MRRRCRRRPVRGERADELHTHTHKHKQSVRVARECVRFRVCLADDSYHCDDIALKYSECMYTNIVYLYLHDECWCWYLNSQR